MTNCNSIFFLIDFDCPEKKTNYIFLSKFIDNLIRLYIRISVELIKEASLWPNFQKFEKKSFCKQILFNKK